MAAKRWSPATESQLMGIGNNSGDVLGRLQSSNDRTSNHTPYIISTPMIKPPIKPAQSIIRPLLPRYTPSPRVDIRLRSICVPLGTAREHALKWPTIRANSGASWPSARRIIPMMLESICISIASVAINFRFPMLQHRKIRGVEHATLKIEIKTPQS